MKYKNFFIIFQGLSVAKNYLRLESAPLKRDSVRLRLTFNNLNMKNRKTFTYMCKGNIQNFLFLQKLKKKKTESKENVTMIISLKVLNSVKKEPSICFKDYTRILF